MIARFIFLFSVFNLFLSCASKHSSFGRNFDSDTIRNGMLEDAVIDLLGPPSKYSRDSKIENQKGQIAVYHFQAPTRDGKFLFKELTVVYINKKVNEHNYRERILLKPAKGARVSNRILDVAGPKIDF